MSKTHRAAALLLALVGLATTGCGSSVPIPVPAATGNSVDRPEPPPDFPGATNSLPTLPAAGETRPGTYYDIYLQSPTAADEQIAITVFEPATLEGGKTYPLILDQHGFGGSRKKDLGTQSPTSSVGGGIDIAPFVAAGYGVISIDQRGHGESDGTIRAMDPDYEGRNLVAILDWAEAKLPWLQRGPDLDGGPDNLVVGAIGASYGGGFQMILHAIDPRHRLDAIVPHITWNDLSTALLPNGVIKLSWVNVLFGVGTVAGSGIDRNHMDPYIQQSLAAGLASNRPDAALLDFYRYHSLNYFCSGVPVATNGGAGTAPVLAPKAPGAIHALFFQGQRDTLFNFNEALRNYQCLKPLGGDVRLLTYEGGHNSLQVVPDPGELVYQEGLDGGTGAVLERRCGDIEAEAAALAFFDEHLKGIPGAANAVLPPQTCLSLGAEDKLLVDEVIAGTQGQAFEVPAVTVLAGPLGPASIARLGYVTPESGAVIAGVPYAELTLEGTGVGDVADPIIFLGVGRVRAAAAAELPLSLPPAGIELLDNQIAPLRGYGPHRVDLVGVAERLSPGDELVLLVYGGHDQYHLSGSANAAEPSPVPVTVHGRLWLPLP